MPSGPVSRGFVSFSSESNITWDHVNVSLIRFFILFQELCNVLRKRDQEDHVSNVVRLSFYAQTR